MSGIRGFTSWFTDLPVFIACLLEMVQKPNNTFTSGTKNASLFGRRFNKNISWRDQFTPKRQ